jgi:large repetitive protein
MSDLSDFTPATTLAGLLLPAGQIITGGEMLPVSITPQAIANLARITLATFSVVNGVGVITFGFGDGTSIALSLTGLGTSSGSSSVTAPSSVQALTISGETATGAVLNWTAPATGSAPITYNVGYRVTGSNANFTQAFIGLTLTNAAITGLTPNIAYDFQVTAVNVAGSSVMTLANILTTAVQGPDNTPEIMPDGTVLTLG